MEDLVEILLMFVTGAVAGFLNTVAGGGSLISLPVLIFWGLPGLEANATNRLAIVGQNIFAVAGFKSKKVSLPKPYIYHLSLLSTCQRLVNQPPTAWPKPSNNPNFHWITSI